jgi:putative ABC transport system permease protein
MNIKIVHSNLFHNKNKLVLSVLGIAASISLLLILLGFRTGLYSTLTAFVDNLDADLVVAQTGAQGMFSSSSALPVDIHDQLVEQSGATTAGHIIMADIIFSEGVTKTPVLLVGYEPGSVFGSPWMLNSGRNILTNNEITLDAWLAERAGINLGDTVSVLGSRFIVVGLTSETSSWMSPYIFLTLKSTENILGLSGIVSYHLLSLPGDGNPAETVQLLSGSVPNIQVLTPDKISDADRRVLANVMDSPINVMLIIGVGIGIAVIGLTSYIAISDQINDYGVLKAVGATPGSLNGMVILETMYRSGLGFVLGIGLANLTAFVINTLWPQFNIQIALPNLLFTGISALFMSLIASIFPLLRLKRIDPIMLFKA